MRLREQPNLEEDLLLRESPLLEEGRSLRRSPTPSEQLLKGSSGRTSGDSEPPPMRPRGQHRPKDGSWRRSSRPALQLQQLGQKTMFRKKGTTPARSFTALLSFQLDPELVQQEMNHFKEKALLAMKSSAWMKLEPQWQELWSRIEEILVLLRKEMRGRRELGILSLFLGAFNTWQHQEMESRLAHHEEAMRATALKVDAVGRVTEEMAKELHQLRGAIMHVRHREMEQELRQDWYNLKARVEAWTTTLSSGLDHTLSPGLAGLVDLGEVWARLKQQLAEQGWINRLGQEGHLFQLKANIALDALGAIWISVHLPISHRNVEELELLEADSTHLMWHLGKVLQLDQQEGMLAISRDRGMYAIMSQVQMQGALVVDRTWFISTPLLLFRMPAQTCLDSLLREDKEGAARHCRLKEVHGSTAISRGSNEVTFVAPEPLDVVVRCRDNIVESRRVIGAWLATIRPGCSITSRLWSFDSVEDALEEKTIARSAHHLFEDFGENANGTIHDVKPPHWAEVSTVVEAELRDRTWWRSGLALSIAATALVVVIFFIGFLYVKAQKAFPRELADLARQQLPGGRQDQEGAGQVNGD